MSSGHWERRNWDKIVAEISSGEDSDAYDGPNVVAVQRNAQRVAELLHAVVPGLDPEQSGAPAMGTNNLNALRESLLATAMRGASPHARASPARSAGRPPTAASEASRPRSATEAARSATEAAGSATEAARPAAAAEAEGGAPATDAAGVLV